jgi:hypothetical protein
MFDDGHGNTTTQTQNVIVDDVTAPIADVATLTDVTSICELTSLLPPTATDECASLVTVTNDAIFPISATTLVTWTYDDGHGNTAIQTQDVIISLMDVSTSIATDGISIEANNINAGVTYQWIDCLTGFDVSGETGVSFTPTAGGDYAVIVFESGCSDTSDCVHSTVGIEEVRIQELSVYPNPTQGVFYIDFDGVIKSIQMFDMLGRDISVPMNIAEGTVDASMLSTGKYLVHIYTESNAMITKMISVN